MDALATHEFSTIEYLTDLTAALQRLDHEAIEQMAWHLVDAHAAGRTVFLCGNGGGSAIASHWAADLTTLAALAGQPRLRVMSLTDSTTALTAAADAFDYSEVFAEQLATFMAPGDVVIGISTSGRSTSVLRAMEYANQHGAVSIGITGSGGTPLKDAASLSLTIASTHAQRVEDVAGITAHLVCLFTRARIAELASATAGV